MNPLEMQKQLLIAESEVNRAQLMQEWQTMAGEVHSLATQARTIGSFASATASLVSGLVFFWHKRSAPTAEKPLWWQTILKNAGLISNIWLAFRVKGHDQKNKNPNSRA